MSPPESEEERQAFRDRALKALRIYFARRRWPRLILSGIVLLTAGAGFLSSVVMLHLGIDRMWLRYPLAALAGWAVFLVLVRAWAEVERRCFEPGENIDDWLKGHDPAETRRKLKDSDWSVMDWLEVPTDFDDAEGCAAGIALFVLALLLLLALGAVLNVIAAAPILIAEVFLDAVLVTALMKRVRRPTQRWWLAGAVRHTAGPVAVTLLALMLAGAVLHAMAPRARSLGEVWRHHHRPELPLLEREEGR